MSENDPRIERVARAICQADGKDPSADHETNEYEVTKTETSYQREPKRIPNWQGYVKEATKFVAAVDALNKN
jgi:hypothetical protein